MNPTMTGQRMVLIAALAAMCVCGFMLTPIGIETRPIAGMKWVWVLPVLLAVTALDFAALGLMFKKPRLAALLAIIAAVSYVFLVPLDHMGAFYKKLVIPRAISRIEIAVLVPAVVVLLIAPLIRRDANRAP